MKQRIESAALHHFGPIGSIVCEEVLEQPGKKPKDIILEIAREVGATKDEAIAFYKTISGK